MTSFVDLNGRSIAYTDHGSGDPLVLVHAFALNKWMWQEQITALSRSRRVIAIDWRGFGESSPGGDVITMDDLADDLAGVITRLEIDKFTLCCLSMGGYAAFAFLRKHRELFDSRVSDLILADTKATVEDEAGKQARLAMAALAEESGSRAIAELSVPKWLAKSSLANTELAERIKDEVSTASKHSIAAAQRGMARRLPAIEILSEIKCPSLVIVGSEDTLTPPSEAKIMVEGIPGGEMAVIEGVGHLSNLEDSVAFNRVIAEWLSRRN